MSRIALIGYRGTGKSTIAKILARELGFGLVELDRVIDDRAGDKIPEIVAKFGWGKFRDLETEFLADVLKQDGTVFDLGGGVVEREENRTLIAEHCLVVWLKADPAVIISRIKDQMHRPSLTGKSFIEEVPEVLARREPLYRSLAQIEIDTGHKPAPELAREIAREFKKRGAAPGGGPDARG